MKFHFVKCVGSSFGFLRKSQNFRKINMLLDIMGCGAKLQHENISACSHKI